jgi:hypothetical protein
MQFRVRLAGTVVAAVISALSLAAVVPTPASAASASGVTYSNSSVCVVADAYVVPYTSDPVVNYSGFVSAHAEAYTNCETPLTSPYDGVSTSIEVFEWTGSSWAYCAGTSWKYDWFDPLGLHADESSYLAGSCGPGWYGVEGAGFVWANPTGGGYQWYGGWVYTGAEWYPATVTAHPAAMAPSRQSQAAAPPGARFGKLPAETPVVNHAGQLVRDTHGNLEMRRTDVKPPAHSAR